jgi:hypothetical protein
MCASSRAQKVASFSFELSVVALKERTVEAMKRIAPQTNSITIGLAVLLLGAGGACHFESDPENGRVPI